MQKIQIHTNIIHRIIDIINNNIIDIDRTVIRLAASTGWAIVFMWKCRKRYIDVKLQCCLRPTPKNSYVKINNMWIELYRNEKLWGNNLYCVCRTNSDTCVRGWFSSCYQPWESYRSVWTDPTVGMFPGPWEIKTKTQEVSFVQAVCIPNNTLNVLCNPLDKESRWWRE